MSKRRESEMRPAEDLAREMVGASYQWIDGRCRVRVGTATHAVEVGDFASAEAAEAVVGQLRAVVADVAARVIERGCVDGAAASSERIASLRSTLDGYRTQLEQRQQEIVSLKSKLAKARRESGDERPRDLAGRVRALVQEYAGRWADVEHINERQAEFEMRTIRGAYRRVVRGEGIDPAWIAALRRGCQFGVADELEAIVRESAGEQR